jgi:hypothetical protein
VNFVLFFLQKEGKACDTKSVNVFAFMTFQPIHGLSKSGVIIPSQSTLLLVNSLL